MANPAAFGWAEPSCRRKDTPRGNCPAVTSNTPDGEGGDAMSDTRCAKLIYWKARPGQFERYTEYLRSQVEPIDHEAQKRGVLVRFSTLVDPRDDAPWSHMRVFEFANTAQRDALVQGLTAASEALTPDAQVRAQRTSLAATLRDRVGETDLDLL
jgi:hypothetical protein